MARLLSLLLGAAAVSAINDPQQRPLTHPQASTSLDDVQPFTEALQARIHSKSLWKRAEKLYQLAEKSTEDYGHPTRVIGSKGRLCSFQSRLRGLAA
jgi:aminopeptidase Y